MYVLSHLLPVGFIGILDTRKLLYHIIMITRNTYILINNLPTELEDTTLVHKYNYYY